jgi:hypothetical protein
LLLVFLSWQSLNCHIAADDIFLNTLEVEGIRFRIALMSNAVNFLSIWDFRRFNIPELVMIIGDDYSVLFYTLYWGLSSTMRIRMS